MNDQYYIYVKDTSTGISSDKIILQNFEIGNIEMEYFSCIERYVEKSFLFFGIKNVLCNISHKEKNVGCYIEHERRINIFSYEKLNNYVVVFSKKLVDKLPFGIISKSKNESYIIKYEGGFLIRDKDYLSNFFDKEIINKYFPEDKDIVSVHGFCFS